MIAVHRSLVASPINDDAYLPEPCDGPVSLANSLPILNFSSHFETKPLAS